ncbi:MAG TPA: hypothetical protein VMZ51_00290 [Acidimicrobiales bacterium]|nr:hypothetical protein [Acidimicrobiales bacterium]
MAELAPRIADTVRQGLDLAWARVLIEALFGWVSDCAEMIEAIERSAVGVEAPVL